MRIVEKLTPLNFIGFTLEIKSSKLSRVMLLFRVRIAWMKCNINIYNCSQKTWYFYYIIPYTIYNNLRVVFLHWNPDGLPSFCHRRLVYNLPWRVKSFFDYADVVSGNINQWQYFSPRRMRTRVRHCLRFPLSTL